METRLVDVIIVGGSYAGLSAGLTLGRSLRKVLIIDSGKPCNWQTPHSHNFLTQDGQTPAAIASQAKEQVLKYPGVQFMGGKAVKAWRQHELFVVETDKGEKFSSTKLLLATGITDSMLPIEGFAECWGISVLHCPYCHGYEVKGEKTGLIGNGDAGFELVKLIHNWSKDLVLFTNGPSTLTEEQIRKIRQYHIPIVETQIRQIQQKNGYIQQLLLQDGQKYPLTAVFARVPFTQHSDLARQLGCAHTDTGYVQTDDFGKTTVNGVYAAGDTVTPMRSVAIAAAAGLKAAASINKELMEESF